MDLHQGNISVQKMTSAFLYLDSKMQERWVIVQRTILCVYYDLIDDSINWN